MNRETQLFLLKAGIGVIAFAGAIYITSKIYPVVAEKLVR